jgi:hypothetical protein
VKVLGGSGSCQDPTPRPAAIDKDDEDVEKIMKDPTKIQDLARQRAGRVPVPPPGAAKDSDDDMQKLMDDPDKMQEYIIKQMNRARGR